jgi:protein TonB
MSLNMPNLASAAGSWIIRFAEMNPAPGTAGENLSAPVAVYKVDPAYPATLARDRVEGVVVLYAVIHSDGSVGQIKVLQGVQDSLDENACTALQKWHFRPATKNGAPVELEAVIQVPFKAPRIGF